MILLTVGKNVKTEQFAFHFFILVQQQYKISKQKFHHMPIKKSKEEVSCDDCNPPSSPDRREDGGDQSSQLFSSLLFLIGM